MTHCTANKVNPYAGQWVRDYQWHKYSQIPKYYTEVLNNNIDELYKHINFSPFKIKFVFAYNLANHFFLLPNTR